MAAIMCTLKLKQALKGNGEARTAGGAQENRHNRACLGNWVATVITETVGRRKMDLVVALNERTYLTVLFPLRPLHAFRRNFTTALAAALADHAVPKKLIEVECAQVEVAPLSRVRDETLKGAVQTAGYIAGVETYYQTALRDVQWNVNQFPYATVDPPVPSEGVRMLFGVSRAKARNLRA